MTRSRLPLWISAALAAALLCFGSPADAQRARAKAKVSAKSTKAAKSRAEARSSTTSGVRTSTWTANGVRFQHKTHGNSKIGWERTATHKDGTTTTHGVLWGSKIFGVSSGGAKPAITIVEARSKTGQTHTTTTTRNKNGTAKKRIEIQPAGKSQRSRKRAR